MLLNETAKQNSWQQSEHAKKPYSDLLGFSYELLQAQTHKTAVANPGHPPSRQLILSSQHGFAAIVGRCGPFSLGLMKRLNYSYTKTGIEKKILRNHTHMYFV